MGHLHPVHEAYKPTRTHAMLHQRPGPMASAPTGGPPPPAAAELAAAAAAAATTTTTAPSTYLLL